MGRPRSFNETEVVDRAAIVFRTRGFTATSIDDLVSATGIHRGSLYGVFGSKHGLFTRALEAASDAGDEFDREGAEARLDIVLVALLEVAPEDTRTAERTAAVIREHGITAQQLGARLMARAGLSTNRESA